ncbi:MULTISPECIES: NAD(P)/FAD-dependent oxidoreductase [unclassified Brevibacterium]|uniref:NAD(P)/FAD-dependent oxidoreductase n=1 Tax=unclassified Brevibacterium TaxID=2614124 RepID=UPI001092D97C|nr:NAD(P)/FAD-dependent oxidoreductase [Brevibacterium sp. S22]TGD32632.1 NAD(P)/FAD-dependent oxidoreductase [Brevibacterium sp. S22]
MNTDFEAIVIGAGPAGLSAAHMLGRAQRSVLVIDAGEPRNRFADRMHGVLGLDTLPTQKLRDIGRSELAPYNVTFVDGWVTRAVANDDAAIVDLVDRSFSARRVIAATGVRDGLPDIPGLAEHWGTRVLHCPYCHGWEVRGQHLAVIATDTMSPYQAQLVRQWTDSLTAFTAAAEPLDELTRKRLRARNTIVNPSRVASVAEAQDGTLQITTEDGSLTAVDAIFLGTTLTPRDDFLPPDLERTVTDHGAFLAVDASGRTSHPRIWAAGNLANIYANVPMSMGAGSALGGAVNADLMHEDTRTAMAQWPENLKEELQSDAGSTI